MRGSGALGVAWIAQWELTQVLLRACFGDYLGIFLCVVLTSAGQTTCKQSSEFWSKFSSGYGLVIWPWGIYYRFLFEFNGSVS